MKSEAVRTIEEGIRDGFAEIKMEPYSYPLLKSFAYFESLRDLSEFRAIVGKQKKIFEQRMEKYSDL
jgi:hypothetical protein